MAIFTTLLIATAVIGIYSYWSGSSNDGPRPSSGSSEDIRAAQRDAEARAEQQRRNENAIRQYRAELAREEARQSDLAARQRLAASQALEQAWREHEEARARALKTPATASTEDDSVRTVDEWRELAAQSAKSRSEAFNKSDAARARGDIGGAQFWSKEGKKYGDLVESHNNRAAAVAFKSINPGYNPKVKSSLERCDLHKLYVKEAEQRVKDHVQACVDIGVAQTVLITGKGSGSIDGIPKIKPAVVKLLDSEECSHLVRDVQANVPNDGCITVRF